MSTRSFSLALVALALAVTMVAAAPRSPAPAGMFLRASACLTPADSSVVRLVWTTPSSSVPLASYELGVLADGSLVYADTVPASAPRDVTVTLGCPAWADSVVLTGGVRAVDVDGRAGEPGTATIVLRTAAPLPPGTPEVSLDTVGTIAAAPIPSPVLSLVACAESHCDLSWGHVDDRVTGYAVWAMWSVPDSLVYSDTTPDDQVPWPEAPGDTAAWSVPGGTMFAAIASAGSCASWPVEPSGLAPREEACRVEGLDAERPYAFSVLAGVWEPAPAPLALR